MMHIPPDNSTPRINSGAVSSSYFTGNLAGSDVSWAKQKNPGTRITETVAVRIILKSFCNIMESVLVKYKCNNRLLS
ncbi:hypothetical protein ES708_17018 [subsurface metagenome]